MARITEFARAIVAFALISRTASAQRAMTAQDFEGVWKISKVVRAGIADTNPQPSLLLFSSGHYSILRINGTQARHASPPAANPAQLTDAEKIARYEEWAPYGASGGTYELRGDTLVTRNVVAKNVRGMGLLEVALIRDFDGNSFVAAERDKPDGGTRLTYTRVPPYSVGAQPAAHSLSPDSAVVIYCAAWNTDDKAERDRLLTRVWTPDGVYSDPNPTRTVGRAALGDTIAALQHRYPGARFHCSTPQLHHSAMRTTWIFRKPDGSEIARGMDFFELAEDGRIRRVTGFFGAPPEVSP